jgi:F0F1-type ATP synthase membrane subunit c/vacuolar-type H+-ATPase subunit K
MNKPCRNSERSLNGAWLAVGAGVGVAVRNVALGLGIGVALGTALGFVLRPGK